MEASRASKGDEGEVAGIAPTFDGDDADGFLHGRVHDANHSGRKFLQAKSRVLFPQPILCEGASARLVEGEISPKEFGRTEATEDEISVGDRGLTAPAIADRAWIGPRGFGTNAKNSGGVEAGERTSASPDRVNIEHGDADGKSGNLGIRGSFGFAFDERDVGGGASHVESDNIFEATGAGAGEGADNASGGA